MDKSVRLVGPSVLIAVTLAGAWSAAIAEVLLNRIVRRLEPVQQPQMPWAIR